MNSFRLRRPARVALTAVCLALGSVAMSACSPIVEERGYIFDPADLDKLQTGSSKEQVRR